MIAKRKILNGTVIAGGIGLGIVRVISPGDVEIAEVAITAAGVKDEIQALEKAVEDTIAELRQLRESAGKKMGGPVAKIFDAQLLVAGDFEFLKQVQNEIRDQKRNAGFVYNSQVKTATAPLRNSKDPYMRQMALDIEAVANRVLSHLSGYAKCDIKFQPNTILVGKSFTPGEVLTYRQRKAIGFVVSEGGRNSHMALISRALMLPVVLVKDAHYEIPDNSPIIIDGVKGAVIIGPTDEDWNDYLKLKKRQGPAMVSRISQLPSIPPKTVDGRVVNVGANLTLPGPADDILAEHKIPVGLYRTEFLYLANNSFPDEETQFRFYSEIAEQHKSSPVVLRTFDLGYDKLATDNNWPQEDNPALGWRGIRAMLDLSHFFKTQIRAILRASKYKNLRIMLPMISDVSEVESARKLIQQEKFKLRKENIPFDDDIKIGIMIEVPSAALTADKLAEKVDFFSIGSNDLTQYTLAADRMNSKVANLYSAFHPSVLKLIHQTVLAGRKHKVPVSVCGEMAGDLMALPLFIGLDIELLSMSPARIFDLCRLVPKINYEMARRLTASVLAADTQAEIVSQLQNYKIELEKKKPYSRRK